ncbi:hypothetical protein [Nostoc foliaceum]|uniref:CpcD n=1 Tax=Nostoc foliaceum FACHB-393 TaxID=2692915 RepID=A0ABR8IJP9_9NOSO|nr:hypothetical protein [Nostoc foliaceum]MBD2651811.1 hypothetical protein [Nostoc foliaceum FACHB-393]
MEIKLTTSEIRTILQGCQYTLQLVGSSKDYRRLQSSEYFSTSNNVVLNDAFNVLGEVVDAIVQVEQFNQQGESGHGARN